MRGTNFCLANVFEDRIPGRAVVISVIDNLVKVRASQCVFVCLCVRVRGVCVGSLLQLQLQLLLLADYKTLPNIVCRAPAGRRCRT